MPKNNGKARKAWRKEAADYNVRWWAKFGNEYTAEQRKNPGEYAAKWYVRVDRPAKVN